MEERDDNQAQKLKELFTEITSEAEADENQLDNDKQTISQEVIDVLNLPPRSEVHQRPKSRIYIRLHSPLFRFLFFILLVLIVLFIVYYFVFDINF